jgi:hypothetical protein
VSNVFSSSYQSRACQSSRTTFALTTLLRFLFVFCCGKFSSIRSTCVDTYSWVGWLSAEAEGFVGLSTCCALIRQLRLESSQRFFFLVYLLCDVKCRKKGFQGLRVAAFVCFCDKKKFNCFTCSSSGTFHGTFFSGSTRYCTFAFFGYLYSPEASKSIFTATKTRIICKTSQGLVLVGSARAKHSEMPGMTSNSPRT